MAARRPSARVVEATDDHNALCEDVTQLLVHVELKLKNLMKGHDFLIDAKAGSLVFKEPTVRDVKDIHYDFRLYNLLHVDDEWSKGLQVSLTRIVNYAYLVFPMKTTTLHGLVELIFQVL